MRDLAIRLETVLAEDRTDDTMCRTGTEKPDIKPDAGLAAGSGGDAPMLPRHLLALASVMRPRPAASTGRRPPGGKPAP